MRPQLLKALGTVLVYDPPLTSLSLRAANSLSYHRINLTDKETQQKLQHRLAQEGAGLDSNELLALQAYRDTLVEVSCGRDIQVRIVATGQQADRAWKSEVKRWGVHNAALALSEEEEVVSKKVEIAQLERGSVPANGWYFTSYRLPLDLAQAIDKIAQKESKDQNTNISFSTAVIRLLEFAVETYGPTGMTSKLEASKHARPQPAAQPKPAPAKKPAPKLATAAEPKKTEPKKSTGFKVKITRPNGR